MHAPAHHPSLSDDAYAVLLDVARQPRSILLATTPRSATRDLLEPPPALSPNTPRLSSAERHLLSHHRDEVARWLQASIARLLSEAPDVGPMYTQQESGAWLEVPSASELATRGAHLLEWTDGQGSSPVPRALRALRLGPRDLASIQALVGVSAGLRADPFHSLVSASLWMAQGHYGAASRTCIELLLHPCSTSVAHAAHSRLGSIAAAAGRWDDAEAAYGVAFRWRAIECTALCALRSSLQAGNAAAVRLWAQRLPEDGPSGDALAAMGRGMTYSAKVGSPWTEDARRVDRSDVAAAWVHEWVSGGAA